MLLSLSGDGSGLDKLAAVTEEKSKAEDTSV